MTSKQLIWCRSNGTEVIYKLDNQVLTGYNSLEIDLEAYDPTFGVGYFLAYHPLGCDSIYHNAYSVINLKLSSSLLDSHIEKEFFKVILDSEGECFEYSYTEELSFENIYEARAVGQFIMDNIYMIVDAFLIILIVCILSLLLLLNYCKFLKKNILNEKSINSEWDLEDD